MILGLRFIPWRQDGKLSLNPDYQGQHSLKPAIGPPTCCGSLGVYGVVLVVAFLLRVILLLEIQDTPLAFWHEWNSTDMAKYLEQAHLIAAGDLLIQDPLIPEADWMRQVPTQHQAAWHCKHRLYQPPLYSYLLSVLIHAGFDVPSTTRWIQILLGCGICLLTVRLTTDVFDLRTGFIAGLIATAYGPMMIIETQLLRGTLILFLLTLGLMLFSAWWVDLRQSGVKNRSMRGHIRLFASMFFLGILFMAHESALFPSLLIAGATAFRLHREDHSKATWLLVICVICWLIGSSPLWIRNLHFGLSPLEPYFGSMTAIALVNHAGRPIDTLDIYFPDSFYKVMIGGRDGMLQLLGAITDTHDGESGRWFYGWLLRDLALLIGPEHNENLSYAYFRLVAPVLSCCLDFRFLLPLAGVGLAVWFKYGRRNQPSRRALIYLLLGYGLLTFGLLSLVYPFGRYRLLLLPVMLPLSGYAIVNFLEAVTARRYHRALALVLLVMGLMILQLALGRVRPLDRLGRLRPADFLVASRMLYQWGRPDNAAAHLDEGIARGLDSKQMSLEAELARGQAFYLTGNLHQARRAWMNALRIRPDDPTAHEHLQRLDAGFTSQMLHPDS